MGLARKVKRILRYCDDLRKKPWRGSKNPVAGHCYIASEALFHLMGGSASGWKPMFVRVQGMPHWYLQHRDGRVIDVTAEQFSCAVPRHLAKGKGFLTKNPSKRTQKLLERLWKTQKNSK